MEVIARGKKRIIDLWAPGKPKETEYKLLRYTLQKECDDGLLLYNAVTGGTVLMNKEEAARLKELPCGYAPWMDILIEGRFLIESRLKEDVIVDGLRRAYNLTDMKKDITGITILPTSGCNARCFYCYECDYPHVAMTKETADKAVEFIAAHCGEKKKVHIGWFGGEPLLGIERMDQIVDGLKERGIDYVSSIISNGYYFTEDVVKKAKEKWKLNNAQITLDGREETYNKTKAYVNAVENPYERVMENISHLAAAGISVSIRLNMGLHNYDELALLLKELAERFKGQPLVKPYIAILFEDMGFVPFHAEGGQLEQLYIRRAELRKLIVDLGFGNPDSAKASSRGPLPTLRPVHCMADNDAAIVINPKGEFAKCEHYTFDYLVGDLDRGICDKQMVKEWKELDYYDGCRDCVFYPYCVELKLCEPERACTKYDTDDKLENAMNGIEALYRKYLKMKAEAEQKKAEEASENAENAENAETEDEEEELPLNDENC